MRGFRFAGILFALTLLAAGQAAADAVDPQIIIRSGPAGTIALTGSPFTIIFGPGAVGAGGPPPSGCTFFTPASLSPDGLDHLGCSFGNTSGQVLFNVQFDLSPAGQVPLLAFCSICAGPPIIGPNGSYARFTLLPIAPGDDMFVELVGLQLMSTTTVHTNVPEPATLALLGTGLGALALRRRKRR